MKIGRYRRDDGRSATGIVVEIEGASNVLDLDAACEAFDPSRSLPRSLPDLIAGGRRFLPDLAAITEAARTGGETGWFTPVDGRSWQTPSDPVLCLCAGRNFVKHLEEAKELWAARSGASDQRSFPTGFIKLSANLVPHDSVVPRPIDVSTLDYEVEVAAVIGEAVERVPEERALDCVFGYTVFNDLSAREWQFAEMENRMVLVGKNFPGAGPIGPWILTADEVPDPQVLEVELRVNGERRQRATCREMIHDFASLISFWSRLCLRPGDVVCSGTPGGVAVSHKPDPVEWYLKPGDVVEAEVRQIGVLRTRIA